MRWASSADRWIACPASLELSKDIPREENIWMAEGTEAHEIAEIALRTGITDATPNAEMSAGAQTYLEFVDSVRAVGLIWEQIEEKLRSKTVPGFSGKVDYLCVFVEDGKVVCHVIDFKYGAGVAVSPHQNKQLMVYCVLFDEVMLGQVDVFRGTIVQPRSYDDAGIKTAEYSREEIEALRREIEAGVTQTHFTVGDHCKWCPAMKVCPEIKRHALLAMQEEFGGDTDLLLFHAGGAIKKYLDAIPERLEKRIKDGEKIPGLKLVTRQGNRQWTATVDKICELTGLTLDEVTERKTLGPATVEKLLAKEERAVIDNLTSRKSLGARVVKSDEDGIELFEEFK